MTIIVGRGRSKATQRIEITDPTVSREHCWLTDNGNGTYTLQNKSPQGTFVDGRQVLKTIVTADNYIQLSPTTIIKVSDLLSIENADNKFENEKKPIPNVQPVPTPKPQVKEYSIHSLEQVWNMYERDKDELSEKQKSIGLLVRVPMLFTALTGILSAVLPPEFRPFTLILTVISALIMFYGFIQQKSFNYQSELNKLNKKMMDDYVCPNPDCRHFLGLQDYKVLRTDKKCRYCGCKFSEK